MPLTRSTLATYTAPNSTAFLWATGIEDTFITEPWPATGRILDEYELTGHYDQWEQDIALMASLGVKTCRYGIPWHKIQPARDQWDWRWADGPLEKLIELGIDPIVDLVHYGTPAWIDGAFTHPEYPSLVADFARRVAERYKGRIHCYTPLNEPRITAWYCGRLGWWPPHLHGARGFLRVMSGVCRGIVETTKALRAVDPEIVIVHVDATDLYEPWTPDLEEDAARRQEIVFLALDLVLGRLREEHPLHDWAVRHGLDAAELQWFVENSIEIDICGINLYPMFSQKFLRRGGIAKKDTPKSPVLEPSEIEPSPQTKLRASSAGRVRIWMPYASANIVEWLTRLYYERYNLPLMVTETASRGSLAQRMRWLGESAEAVKRCRAYGLPLIGYTWWPMFALVAWAYRQGVREPSAYLEQMGLWDLSPNAARTLVRAETPLVAQYRALCKTPRSAGDLRRLP